MNKDIYIITNDVNNMAYIGQTNNITLRWQQHKSAAKQHSNNSPICKAMQEIGIEHFKIQILESDVSDPDKREQYWIKEKNTLSPNGYNRNKGGLSGYGGTTYFGSKFTDETLPFVINDIQNTKMSFKKIAKKYNVSNAIISDLNLGRSYYNKNINYPLRQTRYEKKKFERLVYSLKYELDKSMRDIANEYNIDLSNLSEINQGIIRHVDWLDYPIRSGKIMFDGCKYVKEIIELLKDPTIPQKDIAKKFNVSKTIISGINLGRSYIQPNETYPIRSNYQGKKEKLSLSENEINELEDLLANSSMSMREIAKKYECNVESIMSFNRGSINKYRKSNRTYPIRSKIKQPVSTICA